MLLKEQMLDDHSVSLWQLKWPIERLYEQTGNYLANISVINALCILHTERPRETCNCWGWGMRHLLIPSSQLWGRHKNQPRYWESKKSPSRYYELQSKANSLCVAAKFKRLTSKYEYNSPKQIQTNSYEYKYFCIHGCWAAAEPSEITGTLMDLLMGCDLMENTVWAMNFLMCNGERDGYRLWGIMSVRQCLRSPLAAHHHTVLQQPIFSQVL